MTVYAYTPADYGISHVQLVGVTYDDGGGQTTGNLSNVHVSAALTLDVYESASTGSTQVTSSVGNLRDMDDAPIDQVTVSAGGTFKFQADYTVDLYVTPDAGTTWHRVPPSADGLVSRVTALEAAAVPALVEDLDVDTSARSDGTLLAWDETGSTHEYVPAPVAGDYAAVDHAHTYQIAGVALEQGTDPATLDPPLPDGAVIFWLGNVTFGYGATVGTATGTYGTTAVLTVGSTVAAGTLLVVGVGWGAADVTFTVADSQSNTYSEATTRLYQSSTTGVQLFYSVLTTGLSSGDTITVTSSASTNHIAMVVSSVIGPNATPLDQAATNGQVNTTAPTVGPTSTLASSPQIAFAAIAYIPTDRTFTPDAGWTLAGSASTGTRAVHLIYKEVSDTAAVTAGGTITGLQVITASALATFESA